MRRHFAWPRRSNAPPPRNHALVPSRPPLPHGRSHAAHPGKSARAAHPCAGSTRRRRPRRLGARARRGRPRPRAGSGARRRQSYRDPRARTKAGHPCFAFRHCPPTLLSPNRCIRFTAAFFLTLGYSSEGWRHLEADLRAQHLSQDATRAEQTRHGQKYTIRATLVGPSGRSAEVVSVWVVRTGEEFPRFLTAYPEGDR